MALISCPECNQNISDAASTCIHCGYPISEYVEKRAFEIEVKRLKANVVPIKFKCPEPRTKVCLRCGEPRFLSKSGIEHGCNCRIGNTQVPCVEVDYPERQVATLKLAAEKYIIEHCIIPCGIGDIESEEYKQYIKKTYDAIKDCNTIPRSEPIRAWAPEEKYFGEQESAIPIYISSAPLPEKKNEPTCPICKSTNLSKISSVKKAAKISVFGIFGAGDVGKTWKCNNCGSRF